MIIVIDNYDSFTFNLVQLIGELGFKVLVFRNNINQYKILQLKSLSAIIISPGPGFPQESGISLTILKSISKQIPILGICLGHQSIGYIHGTNIVHSYIAMHGKTSLIYHDGRGLFTNICNPFLATRYHSLIIDPTDVPESLIINAWSEEGSIMGCINRIYLKQQGIQFHPESLWTIQGKQLLKNFLTNT
jgi:anthranilate synthase/aminodeoxychorismate synthase-like glutamine amidotransferase|uniref:Anthranilate synthase component 2 n=1 Tax=Thorea hispida TaxID=202687 RepID=A0A1C9CAI7_9FLOR|nr:anthranilate synthase component 2 [Thorea hispida]AOM65396.1 anthranilate synthase component 2 [Thorea hispida]ARX95766.1 anthranilate synthase component II [Thorea hispida]